MNRFSCLSRHCAYPQGCAHSSLPNTVSLLHSAAWWLHAAYCVAAAYLVSTDADDLVSIPQQLVAHYIFSISTHAATLQCCATMELYLAEVGTRILA
eukprot:scaffold108242_cov31-Tisochrysis_lutea.AAC.1